MPIYEYQCEKCGNRETRYMSVRYSEDFQWCKACKAKLTKIPSKPSEPRGSGDGWYGKGE